MLIGVLFLFFVYLTLLIPGYVLVSRLAIFQRNNGIKLSLSIGCSIFIFAFLSTVFYLLKPPVWIQIALLWAVIAVASVDFVHKHYYKDLIRFKFPLACWLVMAILAACFFSLPYSAHYKKFPDPSFVKTNNYRTLNVKVINLSNTQANDNYLPYRQAQFFVNHLDPSKTQFLSEWDVSFFERTPLLGAYTASYFEMFREYVPAGLLWNQGVKDPDNTYLQFQLISALLNMVFIVPSFFILKKLFNHRAAVITSLFLILSSFFLYNAVFSWPKSLVAFFILSSWLMLLEDRQVYTIGAAAMSGLAYLTHDLAVLYIGTSIIFLLLHKRFRDSLFMLVIPIVFAAPWLYASLIYYRIPSTFIYYPFSTNGIPQIAQKAQIFKNFFKTPVWRLIYIRLDNIAYLLSPTHWNNGIFSVSGAMGYGLVLPFYIAIIKAWRKRDILIFILFPILLESLVVGWPRGLGALHFAEAIVVIGSGLTLSFLLKLKRGQIWILLAYVANLVGFCLFVLGSYKYNIGGWFSSAGSIVKVFYIVTVVLVISWAIFRWVLHKPIFNEKYFRSFRIRLRKAFL